jgi:uncharacterized SAM-binding protein YcdF (DUF218 family)
MTSMEIGPGTQNAGLLRKPNMARKPIWIVLLFCLCLFGVYMALWAMGGVLITADPLEKTDALVILSGGDHTRIDEAVRLYQEGIAREIILTETGIDLPEWNAAYSSEIKLELMNLGIPETAIFITEHQVDSTADEARAIWKLMNTRNMESATIITDPYHSLRTRLIFRDQYLGSDRQFHIHPVRGHWYRSNTWWLSIEGWRVTLGEYFKLFGYLLGFKGS